MILLRKASWHAGERLQSLGIYKSICRLDDEGDDIFESEKSFSGV